MVGIRKILPHILGQHDHFIRVFCRHLLAEFNDIGSQVAPFCTLPVQTMDSNHDLPAKKLRDPQHGAGAFRVIMDHVISAKQRPDRRKEAVHDRIQAASLKSGHNIYPDALIEFPAFPAVFIVILLAGHVVPIPVIGIYGMSKRCQSYRQLFHHDLHTSLSGRNAFMPDHGNAQFIPVSYPRFFPYIVDKRKISIQIARQHPPRILHDTEDPLHTQFLHPHGRTLCGTGQEIKSRTYSYHHSIDLVPVPIHPFFLFRSAQRYPDKICPAVIDPADSLLILRLRQLPEGRRIHTGDPEFRISRQQNFLKLCQRLLRAAVEVMGIPPLLRQIKDSRHQIRPRYTLRLPISPPAADDRQRLSVGQRHSRAVLYPAVFLIPKCHHGRMHIGDTDVVPLQFLQMFRDIGYRILHIGHINIRF